MRMLRGMLNTGRSNLKQVFRRREIDVSLRSTRGIIRSIALVLSLAGATVQAQSGRITLSDAATAPAPVTAQSYRTFTPQPLFVQQGSRATSQSRLNPQFMPQSGTMFAPAGYGAQPNAASSVYPAAFYGPPEPSPGLMPDPMMPDPMMPDPMMPDPMMPDPTTSEYSGSMSGYDMGMGMDGGAGCPHCGGNGCEYCAGHRDGVLAGFLRRLLPYAEGGACAPRWYDMAVEGLYWTRDEVSDSVPFTAFTRFGPTILSSDNLNYDFQPGMRFNSALQILPGISLEFTYFGMFSWSANASVTSPVGDELFSPFSNFGALIGVGLPFDESDQARFHSIRSSSTIDNFELNVRKYWTGPNCRLQGSYRSGVRYVYLVDDLNFFTLGRNVVVGLGTAPAGQSSTDVRAHNSLVGYQSGFDLWANIVPGISVGFDGKAGVYGNHGKQNTRVFGSTTGAGTSADLSETSTNNDIAVVGEANVIFIYRINPNCTIRAGYSALYLDGVALAPDNFNTSNPFNTARTVQELDDDGHVFYHGGFMGFEWMW